MLHGDLASHRWDSNDLDVTVASDRAGVIDLRLAVHQADQPDAPPPSLTLEDAPDPAVVRRIVRDGAGRIVAELQAVLLDGENADQVVVFIVVHPQFRRQGIGRRLAADADRIATAAGRSVLTGSLHTTSPGGPPRSEAGPAFAAAVGWQQAIAELRSKFSMADLSSLAAIQRDAVAASAGYEAVAWAGQVPDELLEAVAEINTLFMSDHPLGALQTRPAPITVARLHAENLAAQSGGVFPYGVLARHRDSGDFVAHTVIHLRPGAGPHAKQWLTMVRPEHRGHRLADLVKVANLQQVAAARPDLRWIWTESAEVNAAMRRINNRFGYVVVDRWLKYQRLLPPQPTQNGGPAVS